MGETCRLERVCQRYNSPTNIHDVINPIPILPTTKKEVRKVSWLNTMLNSVLHTVDNGPKVLGGDDTHGPGNMQSYRNAVRSPHVL